MFPFVVSPLNKMLKSASIIFSYRRNYVFLVNNALIKEYEMSSENLLDERWVYFTGHWKAVSFGKGSVKVFNGSGIHND